MVLKNRGKYLRYFAASPFPLHGKPTQAQDIEASEKPGKRISSEYVAPVDDLSKSSNSNRSNAVAPHVKNFLVGVAGTDGTFTISSTLNDK